MKRRINTEKIMQILNPRFYHMNRKQYKEIIKFDYCFNAKFRECDILPRAFLKGYEWKYIRYYRKFQCNSNNIWGLLYDRKLKYLERKTGISIEGNLSIGKGLIIGHWGKIVINGKVQFGSRLFITHGVTIGRDIRGKRQGVPTFGDRVCIRANATVVGNIHIGNDVLIAPNSFVNFDVPDHSVVVGNPGVIHHRENATEGHIPEMNLRS